MKGLKNQLKKAASPLLSETHVNEQDSESKGQGGTSGGGGEILLIQEDINNSSGNESSSMIRSRNRSSTLEIIEEVETRKEQYLKKSIQNLTEREEDNDTEENEEDEFSDTSKKYCNSAPEIGLKFRDKQEGSEGESQDSSNEGPSSPKTSRKYPIKKPPVFKKRMSIIDECLDQIRKRRDLIAAKLISNTYELDEELLDSSDLSDIDSKKDESQAFNLSQKFNSNNTPNQFSSNNTKEDKSGSKIDEILITPRQQQEEGSYQSNQQNNNSISKLSDNAPIISVEKLDSIINPIKLKPSPTSQSPQKKNQPNIKQSQVQPNSIKQSTIKQSQYMGMSRNINLGGSKKFDLRRSTLYQNIGGLSQSRMINVTSNNLKQSSAFCFEGFQDRQFARQLQKIQEDEDKSLVRQFEKFIDQIKKEKELYVQKIKSKRDNTKDFFKDKNLFVNRQQKSNQNSTKDLKKASNNNSNSYQKLLTKIANADGEEKADFSQSVNLLEVKNGQGNEANHINFQEYEDLSVYELLERIEEEFLSKKQMDPQMSQFLRESMMMSIGGGTSLAFGDHMEKTFFPLVITEQDHANFEMKKQIDDMQERIKHKNLIKLEQMLDKQKKDLKDLEIEYCKLQINYKFFQQNEQLKEDMKREQIKNKKTNKQIARLAKSQILHTDGSQSEGDEDSDEQGDKGRGLLISDQSIFQSQNLLNYTITMNNENFEERQKDVTEIFNQLCSEYGQLKDTNSKITNLFKQQMKELDEKLSFVQNMNQNMEQTLEFNQKIQQFQQNNKNMLPKKQIIHDNDNELATLVREVQLLEQQIEYQMNYTDIEFQFKKKKKIIQLLSFKNKLSKLQFQREFQTLVLDIGYNQDILMENKENLQNLLSALRDKFEELKEYNLVYKDSVIEEQMTQIETLKIEIQNNQLIQRDLSQKHDVTTRVLQDVGYKKINSIQQKNSPTKNNHQKSPTQSENILSNLQSILDREKQDLLNEINRTRQQNMQVEREINNLKFDEMNQTLTNQNMYIEQLKQTYYIQV